MRLIDADALKEWVEEYHTSNWGIPQDELIYAIGSAQTIDPVKHGKWIYNGVRGRFPVCECSVCGNAENADWAILGDNVNYCPNCGTKMDGEG